MLNRRWWTAGLCTLTLLLCGAVAPAGADLSGFISLVQFDEDVDLEDSMGMGVRFGKAGKTFGGETSILFARPERDLGGAKEAVTALIYGGRFMINIPAGSVRPFVGAGLEAVTVTSADVPAGGDQVVNDALDAVASLSTNTALSYGGGVRYMVAERLAVRLDLRQFLVFSVTGIAKEQLAEQVNDATGGLAAGDLTKDSTAQYNELSLGVTLLF